MKSLYPKGYAMMKHKAGLHKDVAKIFDGVWIPQIDNIQLLATSSIGTAVSVHPKPVALEKWSKEAKASTPAKASNGISWNIFSPKARREKKRLSSISRNLLINLPD